MSKEKERSNQQWRETPPTYFLKKSSRILEESSKKELAQNMQRFQRDALQYKGGQWTKEEAIHKIFIPDYKKYNIDSYQFIVNKYKNAEKLWSMAREGSEIFQDLQHLVERGGRR
ncbi:hypothetical protein A0J61_01600 [Choanephora cucurbitarum]|uniref:Uncharacterized protein n=1 Tax=Choanephora cucurbitarum TaxID=101091 RepID=A0A1C7NMG8_9FUNG|nr:hypothetical protein A0J61_01600 [Choanephora cucurbitarum]